MGTTINDFRVIIKGIRQMYARKTVDENGAIKVIQDPIPDEYTFNLWYSLLQDIDYPTLNKAVRIHMQSSPYVPTVADIRQIAADIKEPPGDAAGVAWEQVMKALARGHATEEYEKLPEISKRIIGGPATLREWGNTSVETLQSVQRPMFIKRYEVLRERERKQAALPPDVRFESERPVLPAVAPQRALPPVSTTDPDKPPVAAPESAIERLRRRLA